MICNLKNSYIQDKGFKSELIAMLQYLDTIKFAHIPSKDDFLAIVKAYLTSTLNALEDFEYFVCFGELFPDMMEPGFLKEVHDEFLAFYQTDVQSVQEGEDSMEIESYVMKLDDVSLFLT